MICYSPEIMSPALEKLFKLILKSGAFPSVWCEGSITPIFKVHVLPVACGNCLPQS